MSDDAAWYEAAFVVGMTNALNVAAEGVPALAAGVLTPVDEAAAVEPLATLFAEIRAFYSSATVPAPFRLVALDPAYARDLWEAVQRAFAPNRLPRPLKEALAFAVSLTTRSG